MEKTLLVIKNVQIKNVQIESPKSWTKIERRKIARFELKANILLMQVQ